MQAPPTSVLEAPPAVSTGGAPAYIGRDRGASEPPCFSKAVFFGRRGGRGSFAGRFLGRVSARIAPGIAPGARRLQLQGRVVVALVPGEAFGAPGYMRLSYALGDEDLEEGLQRRDELLRFLAVLEDPRVRVVAVEGGDARLSGNERSLFQCLASRPSFDDLCRSAGLDPLSAARTVQLLRLVGAVQLTRSRGELRSLTVTVEGLDTGLALVPRRAANEGNVRTGDSLFDGQIAAYAGMQLHRLRPADLPRPRRSRRPPGRRVAPAPHR